MVIPTSLAQENLVLSRMRLPEQEQKLSFKINKCYSRNLDQGTHCVFSNTCKSKPTRKVGRTCGLVDSGIHTHEKLGMLRLRRKILRVVIGPLIFFLKINIAFDQDRLRVLFNLTKF